MAFPFPQKLFESDGETIGLSSKAENMGYKIPMNSECFSLRIHNCHQINNVPSTTA